jgi:hypothetical protein
VCGAALRLIGRCSSYLMPPCAKPWPLMGREGLLALMPAQVLPHMPDLSPKSGGTDLWPLFSLL